MIRARILIALVAAIAIGLSKAQEECKQSIHDGPLANHHASLYSVDMFIEPGSSVVRQSGSISMDNHHESGEPGDVIVLHADKSIQVEDIQVRTDLPGSESDIPIESICRDSAKQLLVIKLKRNLDSHESIKVSFSVKISLRGDGKGLHKLENGVIRANFADSEARLIFPCIAEEFLFHRPSNFQIELTNTEYRLKSVCSDLQIVDNDGNTGKIRLDTTDPTDIEDIWFELEP